MSAIALEEAIKKAANIDHFDTYRDLVAYAKRLGKLEPDEADFACIVFSNRTQIVHHNYQPRAEDAVDTLVMTRGILGGILKDKEPAD